MEKRLCESGLGITIPPRFDAVVVHARLLARSEALVRPLVDARDGTIFTRGSVDPAAMAFGVDVPFYEPGTYWVTRFVLQRGLAAVYLVAFVVALRQFRPLCGEDGLLPIGDYVDRFAFRERPSLLYVSPTDRAAAWLARAGVALSALALLGVPSMLGTPVAVAVWVALWALYLSFANAGQLFYGYGWESMLCEAGALAVFLGGWDVATPAVTVWLFRWLLLRNMLGAGLIKLRGDDCWRDLTCMHHHYETQPMPNPASWFAHHLPDRVHRVEVAGNHVVELAVPLLYFAPQPVSGVAGAITVAFMGWLLLTGNFSWLNALTVVLACSLFADPQLAAVANGLLAVASGSAAAVGAVGVDLALSVPEVAASGWFTALAWTYALVVLALSYHPVRNMLSAGQRMNTSFDPLNLVNAYGAFGHVTKTRYELVVQGTTDEVVDDDTEWETYEFHGKPTDVSRRPPQWAPYHLRLDWQLWFAAMQPLSRNPWFLHFLAKLLDADEGTLSLVRTDPFDGERPEHVRALRYEYRYTTPAERRETGDWWRRERVGTYAGPMARDSTNLELALRRRGWNGSTRGRPSRSQS